MFGWSRKNKSSLRMFQRKVGIFLLSTTEYPNCARDDAYHSKITLEMVLGLEKNVLMLNWNAKNVHGLRFLPPFQPAFKTFWFTTHQNEPIWSSTNLIFVHIYIPFHTLKPSPTAHLGLTTLGFCLLSFWFLPMLRQNGNLTFEFLKKLCFSPIIRSSPHQLTQPTHRCVWIILILMFDHNFPTKITIIGRWIPRFSSTKPAHSVLSFLHHDSTIFRYLSLQLTLVMTTTGGFSYANINDLGAIGALGTSMRTFH